MSVFPHELFHPYFFPVGFTAGGYYRVYTQPTLAAAAVLLAEIPPGDGGAVLSGFDSSSVQLLQVKSVCPCGVQDGEVTRLKRVAFDSAGNFILPVPNRPIGLKLIQTASGGVTVRFSYVANNQAVAPDHFNVYVAVDDDAFDFDTPDETVNYYSARSFSKDLGSFNHDQLVKVVVRAESAAGTQELNVRQTQIRADSLAPAAVSYFEVGVSAE